MIEPRRERLGARPTSAGVKAFFGSIWNSVKSVANGDAGRALGDRWVAVSENRSGKAFDGSAGDWKRFWFDGFAGDFSGVNPAVEAVSGYDMQTEEKLSVEDRIVRAAQATAAIAGNAAGGLSVAAHAPKAVPTLAKAGSATMPGSAAVSSAGTTLRRAAGNLLRDESGALRLPKRLVPGYGWTNSGWRKLIKQLQNGDSVTVASVRIAAELVRDAFPTFVRSKFRGRLSEMPDLRGTYDWHNPAKMPHGGPHTTPHVQIKLHDGRWVRIEVKPPRSGGGG